MMIMIQNNISLKLQTEQVLSGLQLAKKKIPENRKRSPESQNAKPVFMPEKYQSYNQYCSVTVSYSGRSGSNQHRP